MDRNLKLVRGLVSAASLALLFLMSASPAFAQSATQVNSATQNGSKSAAAKGVLNYSEGDSADESSSRQDPRNPPTVKPRNVCGVNSGKQCFKDFLNDQKGIWTSPLHIKPWDAEWLLPMAAATAVSLHFDAQAINTLGVSRSRDVLSRRLSNVGSPYSMVGFAATAYLIGHYTHNDKVREIGMLSAEALADTLVITEVVKYATNRERPFQGSGTGKFYPDGFHNYPAGLSMPSGHAAGAFAVAKIISDETRGNTWLHIGLYGLATAVGAARIIGHEHFPTDVLIGGTFGYLIGGYVYHLRAADSVRRSDPAVFAVMPISDASTRSYGVMIVTNGSLFHGDWRLPNPFHRKGSGN